MREGFLLPRNPQKMSCNCKLYLRRLDKLQKKYAALRKNHKKLLGVTVLLTEALEELIKGDVKTEINDTLSMCSSIYPDLFYDEKGSSQEAGDLKVGSKDLFVQVTDENGESFDAVTESEKEYFEGFMARPRIPRTPQV